MGAPESALQRSSRLGGRTDAAVRARRAALAVLGLLAISLFVFGPLRSAPAYGSDPSWHPGAAYMYKAESNAFAPSMGELPTVDIQTELVARPTNQSGILLVTAFFPLEKSKHSLADYANWAQVEIRRLRASR